MKKRLLILGLFILLLFPFNIKADNYKYTTVQVDRSKLESYGLQWPTTSYRVSSTGVQNYLGGFWFHAIDGEVSLCGGIGKETKNNSSMIIHDGTKSLDPFKNAAGQTLNDNQKKLLMDFLANTEYHTGTLSGLETSKSDTIRMIANQIIAWEIIEGGRTSFKKSGNNPYEPDYNNNDSAYKKVIVPNSGSGSLFEEYKKILDICYSATIQEPASFNNKKYVLKWNYSKKRYEVEVPNLGKYVNCSSANSHINVSVSDKKATIYTTVPEASQITCKYTTGNGTLGQADKFTYFEFPNQS